MKNVKYGKCVRCGKTYEARPDLTSCTCGGILDIVYDYDYIRSVLTKEKLARRENRSMWRYRELLPVEETTPDTPLRVGWSPLYEEPNLARLLGLRKLWIKDDGQNPTASLKDRASAMAVAKAYEAGARTIACSSTGNAASSLAGNAAAAGFKTYIFVPERAPKGKVAQLMIFGANVISVKGNYEETFKMSAQAIEKYGWYNRNAAINPYLSEGKKTVALEIAEQLKSAGIRVKVDDRDTYSAGWKFNEWEMKGVPARIEVGPRDIENGVITVCRRDTLEKIQLPMENVAQHIQELLEDIQQGLFEKAKAFRDAHIKDVTNMEELGEAVQDGFARAMWCGDDACELEVKARFNAKTRNMPFDQTPIGDTCVCCAKKATKLIYFGKQY